MKILCVGDSLGMPREGVLYEDTWFYKMKTFFEPMGIDIIPQFRRALTSTSLSDPDYSVYFNPDLVILQVGICDCAPRKYRRTSVLWIALRTILNRIQGNLFDSIIRHRSRKMKYADVPINIFKKNIENYYCSLDKQFGGVKMIIIKIGASGKDSIISASPELSHSIECYNRVFDELAQLYKDIVVIDPHKEMDETHYVEDGYHTNTLGNQVVYKYLEKTIITINNNKDV